LLKPTDPRRPMNAKTWLAAYADQLGTEPPSADELRAILDLAAEAAHASERIAAPVACWLSAKSGKPLEESLALARSLVATGQDPDRE
jgi:hypothetical protein